MRRVSVCIMALLIGLIALHGGAAAQSEAATPTAVVGPTVLVLIERADTVAEIDIGEPGPSTGDLTIWGPNPLYDETNTTDTGATTQGACIVLIGGGQCVMTETIIFPDGSTLHLQGIEAGGSGPSTRTIIGGTGAFLGAVGSVTVEPEDDLSTWIKTIEYWIV